MATQNRWISVGPLTAQTAADIVDQIEAKGPKGLGVEVIDEGDWFYRAWSPEVVATIVALLRDALPSIDPSTDRDRWLTITVLLDDMETWLQSQDGDR